ncbi:MAG: phage tail assembly chaperone, partial [Sphingomicrobium sp.]
MIEKFGASAARLAGAAAALLGWRPGEFWSATPAELASVLGLGGEDAAPADRTIIEALLARFPDEGG